jgi:hypothetical protein
VHVSIREKTRNQLPIRISVALLCLPFALAAQQAPSSVVGTADEFALIEFGRLIFWEAR